MKIISQAESILKVMESFSIIDAHEHLPPEKTRVEQKTDVFTLFSHYTKFDLLTSGMTKKAYDRIQDTSIPIDERWKIFSPYLKNIRHSSYARPAFIAAKELYGFDDINEANYKALSEEISSRNTSGIYHRILRKKCKIRVALTLSQANPTDYDYSLLRPLGGVRTFASLHSRKAIDKRASDLGETVKTLDDYLGIIRKGLEKMKSIGIVGLKMMSRPYDLQEKETADSLFNELMRDEKKFLPQMNPFIMEEILDMAAEVGLVVAVHTGMWGDFRQLDPQHMIPLIMRHPNTKFDIFHLGVPYVREASIMGKNFPNVWLNLCWLHIISPRIACMAMDELLDLMPTNKIIAFGGDYNKPVEKVYGHLAMARENIAKVLGDRVKDRLMTEDEAIEIARQWFYENPKHLYQLNI